MGGTARGIDLDASTMVLNIMPNGAISTIFSDAIRMDVSAQMTLRNTGAINNKVVLNASDGGADFYVANDGVIQSRDTAVVIFAGTGDIYMTNTGTISSIIEQV